MNVGQVRDDVAVTRVVVMEWREVDELDSFGSTDKKICGCFA